MKYFINSDGDVFGFESDGSQDHLILSNMVGITFEEVQSINKAKEDKYKSTVDYKINAAKSYLASTDFYMTVDKYETLTAEKQIELKSKRAEARALINSLELELMEVING